MFLNSLFLAISSSIDSLGIGITYGIKNTRISNIAKIVLFLISFFVSIISLWFGNVLKKFLPDYILDFLGSCILIFMGIFFCFQALRKNHKTQREDLSDNLNNIYKTKTTSNDAKIYSFFIKFLGITIQIIKNPNSSDFDKSNCIDAKEALFLGLALSLDTFCIGIGFSMMNISSILFPILACSFQLIFLSLGIFFGKKLYNFSKLPDNVWSIISGLLLIIIGILK